MILDENFDVTKIPSYVQTIADLPKGKALILKTGPLSLPKPLQEQMALFELMTEENELSGQILMIIASGFETSIHVHNFKKIFATSKDYKLLKTLKIDKQLMGAIYSQDSFALESSDNNDLITFFDKLIEEAMNNKVSDIHIEKRTSSAIIRMRMHGELLAYKGAISPKYASDLCAVIYNILGENKDVTYMEDEYQACAINRIISSEEVKLRYQSLPVYPGGFDVVMRVLPIGRDDEGYAELSDLGYSLYQVYDIHEIISKPVGAMIIAGTTGSGKSTTLKNLLMYANASRGYKCKIYTVEDPPEYKIPRVSQIPVIRRKNEDYTKKSPFADPLMATMRGDPDILMIGEIRDAFTGDGLKKATQSGHQVMTTTHASSGLAVIERLTDFGISESVMGSPEFLTGLIYQKLMPILCAHCSVPISKALERGDVDDSMLQLAARLGEVCDFKRDTINIRGPGCEHCKNGVTGRTVCAEVIVPDFKMLSLFREQNATGAYIYWRSLSDNDNYSSNMTGKPALEHALFKMRQGILSPHDIEESFGPVNNALKVMRQITKDSKDKEEKPADEWDELEL